MRIETYELADLAERNATFVNQPPDEPSRYTEPCSYLAHVEQRGGRVGVVRQLTIHALVKAMTCAQRDKSVSSAPETANVAVRIRPVPPSVNALTRSNATGRLNPVALSGTIAAPGGIGTVLFDCRIVQRASLGPTLPSVKNSGSLSNEYLGDFRTPLA